MNLDNQDTKTIWQSKTWWLGIVLAAVNAVRVQYPDLVPDFIWDIVNGIVGPASVMGLRTLTSKKISFKKV